MTFATFLLGQATPTVGYDLARLRRDASALKQLCDSIAAVACYSVKANRNSRILAEFAAADYGADIASKEELALATAARLSPIVATAPGLDAGTLTRVDGAGGTIYFDHLAQVALGAAVGIDLSRHGIRVSMPGEYAAFGFAGRGELRALRARFGFRPRKLHVHCGEIGSRGQLSARLKVVEPLVEAFRPSHINLGGGYAVLSNDWNELRLAFAMLGEFARRHRVTLIFEFGKVATARSGSLVTTVVGRKIRGEGQILVVDASTFNLGTWEQRTLWRLPSSGKCMPTTIIGPTCYEEDVFLAEQQYPATKVGGKLIFGNFGAYCMSIGSCLHGLPLPQEAFLEP